VSITDGAHTEALKWAAIVMLYYVVRASFLIIPLQLTTKHKNIEIAQVIIFVLIAIGVIISFKKK